MRRIVALLCVVLMFTACASKEESEALKPMKLVSFDRTVKLKKLWTSDAGKGQDRRYSLFVPAVEEGVVYAADVEGQVFAFNAENGKRLWKIKLKRPVSGAISSHGDKVFLATYGGGVIALSAEDGALLWEAKASSEILAPPVSSGSVVSVNTIDGRVYTYDANTGEQIWTHDHPVPILTLRGNAAPVVTNTQVIVGFDNGQVVSLNAADGSLGWEVRVAQPRGSTDLERMVDIDGTPVLDGAFLYAGAYHGAVTAIARGTGRVMWSQEASTHQGLAVGGGNVYVVTEDDSVIAYNSATGSVEWRNDQLLRRNLGAPAVIGNYVVTIDEDEYMHVLSQTDGSFAARLKPPGDDFRSPLVSVNDILYVLADNGKLSAYRIAE